MKSISLFLLVALTLSAKTYTLQPAPTREQMPHQKSVELKVSVNAEKKQKASTKRNSRKTPKFRWHADIDKALQDASDSELPILLVFTAPDWCYWCQKLEQEVFSQQVFKNYATKHFIPCKMDFSKKISSLPKEQQEKRRKICSQYRINSYPTVLLLDAEGKILARTGYVEGGAETYIRHLKELLKK